MTVLKSGGFTYTNGKHAHILHAGNSIDFKTITASAEAVSGNGQLVKNGATRERWKPHSNDLLNADDLSKSEWSTTNATVTGSGKLLTEGTVNGAHIITQSISLSATAQSLSAIVRRRDAPEVVLEFKESGSITHRALFDLRDGTKAADSNTDEEAIRSLGDDRYLLTIRFTPASGSGDVNLRFADGGGNLSAGNLTYTGTSRSVYVEEVFLHETGATLTIDAFGSQSISCIAIGAHDIWSRGAEFSIEADSGGGFSTVIDLFNPDNLFNDSPIMIFLSSASYQRFRLTLTGGATPSIGVIRIGNALVMNQGFYQGFAPARMNRQTRLNTNMSRTGELLGRKRVRTTLREQYNWTHLPYSWVRSNLDGPSGLIQSMEEDSAFVAWRPELVNDVAYVMRAEVDAPQASGPKNYWSFGMDAEVYSYE